MPHVAANVSTPQVGEKLKNASHASLDPKVVRELSRLNDGVPFRPKQGYLHHTWAQTFYSRPELYFQPETIPELQKIVTLARRCRKRICVKGFGHSPSDLTCTSSWMVNLDNLARILEYDVDGKPGLVRFQAGISLKYLNLALAGRGWTLPNLGSINVQSVAGVISTGTHGSSLQHGLLSQSITSLTILLANAQLVSCSAQKNPELFKAALLSLGALGIVVEITFQTVPDFNISWVQSLQSLPDVLSAWSGPLWTTAEFTRVWWLPYLQRAVVWRAKKTDEPVRPPEASFYGGTLGYYVYHNLLALSNTIPRILPWVEWFVFGMQYGFKPGKITATAVQPAREGLLMDCLYSQFVNEWALPLDKGPEALTRLSAWINHDEETARIPVSSKGVWVHCPIEVRVSDTTTGDNHCGVRPYLDPTNQDGPTLYLNATLYRPYGRDPPCRERYYEAFEWLMRELGGRPHWAKNFAYTAGAEIAAMYTDRLDSFMQVRDEVDSDGMFLGEWHRRNLSVGQLNAQSMCEGEVKRSQFSRKHGDAVLWEGHRVMHATQEYIEEDTNPQRIKRETGQKLGLVTDAHDLKVDGQSSSPSPTMTGTSEESFDYMAKGEASVLYHSKD